MCLALGKLVFGLGPQLSSMRLSMRLISFWMVSVDQDHTFHDQHLLQLGIRLGHFTVVSRVPCARVVYCAARREREDSVIIDLIRPMIVEKSF